MFKNLCITFIDVSLLLLLLVGCNTTQQPANTAGSYTTKYEQIPASSSIQELTESTINSRYKNVADICFEDYENIDNIGYLAFSYKNKQLPYCGFTVAQQDGEQYKLSYFEDYSIAEKEPVSITQFIGTYPGTKDRKFHITIGYINNDRIKQIILYYPQSNVKVIQLGEDQHVFLDINVNSKDSLLKIEGRASNGNIVYKKDSD
ncbi:hypothetical protein [Mahella australiensis]|uniref:Lipoprotein n=1 Tax=Mahella australiensis (strain DSM 15567 / CIP 107919 / 50-1 BON) TaxID=697281 RepID=F3ZZB2_MAHA5|nr:hypothetical protein [Mahella australiensis]AEE95722.1 hypothetical protein Mahau_0517 [Mahella australiensis 50-1 BON]